jgi:hypothetical protein
MSDLIQKWGLFTGEQYRSLNDAVESVGDPRYEKGPVEIWYLQPDKMRDSYFIVPHPKYLKITHALLGSIAHTNLEDIFEMMQGANWSPQGQARNLIQSKGLGHTSMSAGDVIVKGGSIYRVAMMGFEKVEVTHV